MRQNPFFFSLRKVRFFPAGAVWLGCGLAGLSIAGRTTAAPQYVPIDVPIAVETPAKTAPEKRQFARDIRPILAENCFGCHGAATKKPAAGLRLDTSEDALAKKDDVAAIVPGHPEKSELIARIFSADDPMPPAKTHKVLTSEQKESLRQWIVEGASYNTEEPKTNEPKTETEATAEKPMAPQIVAPKPVIAPQQNAKATPLKSVAKKTPIGKMVPLPAGSKLAEKLQFNRDIRPILSDNCFLCHGPDKNRRKAGLRLDQREAAIKDGAIVPGKPNQSELVARIFSHDANEVMPPAKAHKTLTAAQKSTLRKWIAQGAAYQPAWGFVAPQKVAPPAISDAAWAKNPIDHFIGATLDARGWKPSREAPKALLLRRVCFDLTGLPPTTAELDAFLADKSPNAYEKVVDKLLTKPTYGEHMARYWLDAARYADTHGMHFDNERHIWPYRDWVVKAFNENLPFDQFAVDQLAGDLLPHPTRDQLVATGFNRCSPTSNEGGSIDAELLFRYATDRTATTSSVFLGLTAACATCHDHKFDPISQKEFYQLNAFFTSVADPALDGNDLRTAPILKLSSPEQDAQMANLDKQIGDIREKIKATVAKVAYTDPGLQTPPPAPQLVETVWMDDSAPIGADARADGSATNFISATDGPVKSGQKSLKRSGEGTIQDIFEKIKEPLAVPPQGTIFAQVYLDPKNPPKAIMLQFNIAGEWKSRLNWGDADAIDFGAKGTPQKIQAGDLPPLGQWVQLEWKVEDLKLEPNTRFSGLAFTQSGGTVYWDKMGVRYDSNPATDPEMSEAAWQSKYFGHDPNANFPPEIRDLFKLKIEEMSVEQKQKLHAYYLSEVHSGTRAVLDPMRGEIMACEGKKKAIDDAVPATLIMADLPTPRTSHIMIRGEYDKPGEEVQPGTPAVLPPLGNKGRATRLDLAKWIVSPQHPLTARVYVNRLWQQCFGVGLVKTSGDFGAQGETPSHPELLDWLAVDFREHKWDIKRMMRLMVTSAAYRQDSFVSPAMRELDPENRFLSHGPRFRLDAEEIRDDALFVSGLMDFTMGGRGVRPYQPINIWEPLAYPGSNTDKYMPDKGGALYRRSLYTFWKRTAPHPAATAFDAPSRESSCLRRERNNTPLQALVLMNDVQHFEAARALAQRVLISGPSKPEARLNYAFRIVTARYPNQRERPILKAALDKQIAHFAAHPEAAKEAIGVGDSIANAKLKPTELAAYTMVCSLLLNLDEALTKN